MQQDNNIPNEESDLDKMVSQLGPCAPVYWELDVCLDNTNHSWTQCQAQVKNLKKCYEQHPGQSQKMNAQRAAFSKLQKIRQELDAKNQ